MGSNYYLEGDHFFFSFEQFSEQLTKTDEKLKCTTTFTT
jgi:hypothetical protein